MTKRAAVALCAALALVLTACGDGIAELPVRLKLDGRAVGITGADSQRAVHPQAWVHGDVVAVAGADRVAAYDKTSGDRRWSVPLAGRICAFSTEPVNGRVAIIVRESAGAADEIAVLAAGL